MLELFRRSAQTKVMKILLIILALTFLLWGFGEVLRNSSSGIVVLEVGKSKVYDAEWNRLLGHQIAMRENLIGRKFTEEEINDPKFRSTLLNMLINRKIIEQVAVDMNLLLDDELIKKSLAEVPFFRDEDGKFDVIKLQAFLRSQGKTEQQLFIELEHDMQNSFVVHALRSLAIYPPQMPELLEKAYLAEHVIDLYSLKFDFDSEVMAPSDAELEAMLAQKAAEFTIPEHRTISYMVFDARDVNVRENFSHDEIQEYYDDNIALFTKPEKRHVKQIIFASQEEALAAASEIAAHNNFMEVALEHNDKEDIDLGMVTTNSLLSEIAQEVFSLQEGEVSVPVKTPLGWHIFSVDQIVESHTIPLESARVEVKKRLIEDSQYQELNLLAQHIDTDVVSEHSLEDIAQNYGLTIKRDVFAIEAGLADKQNDSEDLQQNLKGIASNLSEGEISIVTHHGVSDSYYVVRLDSVQPAHMVALEDAKEQLLIEWKAGQKAAKVQAVFGQVAEAIKSNDQDSLASLTKEYGITKERVVLTNDDHKALAPNVAQQLMELLQGELSAALYDAAKSRYLIGFVAEIRAAQSGGAGDQKQTDALRQNIARAIANSNSDILLEQIIEHMKQKYIVKVNNAAVFRNIKLNN